IVDHYFPLVDRVEERIEAVEDRIGLLAEPKEIMALHKAKRALHELLRMIRPLPEVMDELLNPETPFITNATRVYLGDCADHVPRIIEQTASGRVWSTDLMDLGATAVGNRLNEVMKVLTVVTAIFIPLSFSAGVYGMNFNPAVSRWNMP